MQNNLATSGFLKITSSPGVATDKTNTKHRKGSIDLAQSPCLAMNPEAILVSDESVPSSGFQTHSYIQTNIQTDKHTHIHTSKHIIIIMRASANLQPQQHHQIYDMLYN